MQGFEFHFLHSHGADISEDRVVALRKRDEIDPKYVLVFSHTDASELRESFSRLAAILAELSDAYYREQGRRLRTRVEKSSSSYVELNIWYCFKVGVFAEFRKDWLEALKFYEEAYNALCEFVGLATGLRPIQHLVEIKAVAEQLSFKVVTLLFHVRKPGEAVSWFWRYIAAYKKLTGSLDVLFLHWEWVSRQFLVFAELLELCPGTVQSTAFSVSEKQLEWDTLPAYFYQLAANYLREKKHNLDIALSTLDISGRDGVASTRNFLESVVPSFYIGQVARLNEQEETFMTQALTDEEYVLYALAEGKRLQETNKIIALFKKSMECYSNMKAQRISTYCAVQMAREYFAKGDFYNARLIFDSLLGLYRQEGWITLLWEVLGYLRECSRRLGYGRDFIEYSLEMAALPMYSGQDLKNTQVDFDGVVPASLNTREKIQKEIIDFLKREVGMTKTIVVLTDQPFQLEIDHVSPLRSVLLVSVAFHDQALKLNASAMFTLSLLSQLPLPLHIEQLEILFNQPKCNFIITRLQEHPLPESFCGDSLRTEVGSLILFSNKWLRLTYDVFPGRSGKLECLSVIAKISPCCTICCRAESPASMEELPLWKYENRVESFPTKEPSLSFSGQRFIQIEEPESQVELILESSVPTIVGEIFVVSVAIASKGSPVHSGELKINLVDVKGGGFVSPRETESNSPGSLHVELLGISGSDREKNIEIDLGSIKKIQQTFGLVSIPALGNDDSWSCKLEMRWNEPQVVTLFVSLGYLPRMDYDVQRIHIHKNLQIEGKNPFSVNHHFGMPFRRELLLPSRLKSLADSEQTTSLAVDEACILIVSAQNSTEVPLKLISASIEVESDVTRPLCTVKPSGEILTGSTFLGPGEEFRWIFSVIPLLVNPRLSVGSVQIKWTRGCSKFSKSVFEMTTKYRIPEVHVEKPLLAVSLEPPPHAVVGVPFVLSLRIRNYTHFLQEISYSLLDSPSFVLSGSHKGGFGILPNSESVLVYKLVSLTSGQQYLPQILLTSERYSARLQPTRPAAAIFVFPSQPHFDMGCENFE